MRRDLTLQTAVGRADALSSGPILCRLEAAATSRMLPLREVLLGWPCTIRFRPLAD